MIKNNCKVILVIDDEDNLKGILTLTDICVSPELIGCSLKEIILVDYVIMNTLMNMMSILMGCCEKCGVYSQLTSNGQYMCSDCIDNEISDD